ncbi:MAG: 1-acyl-sn-glycerol-3-phosphate acyltransferase [Ruminococcus sp.]|nr:1-acyl-sn-glycerol-3-phosphate acyltransferase [Ruminococcus sp.]
MQETEVKIKEHLVFYNFAKILLIPIFKLIYRYKVIKECELPKTGSYMIASNHLSNTDPVFVGLTNKRRVYFMAKVELFKNKFFGGLIRILGAFPVTRGANDGKAIATGEDLLNHGKIMTIFIEGGRTKTGELMRPRSGCAVIARQTKAPVVPMCITVVGKTHSVFSKRIIHIGKPISYEELGFTDAENPSPKEYREASKIIMAKITEFRETDRVDK